MYLCYLGLTLNLIYSFVKAENNLVHPFFTQLFHSFVYCAEEHRRDDLRKVLLYQDVRKKKKKKKNYIFLDKLYNFFMFLFFNHLINLGMTRTKFRFKN